MKYTKYRKYLERTERELKGENDFDKWEWIRLEFSPDHDKWGDRAIIAVVICLPLLIIIGFLMG